VALLGCCRRIQLSAIRRHSSAKTTLRADA
jgi:hypothetical protein